MSPGVSVATAWVEWVLTGPSDLIFLWSSLWKSVIRWACIMVGGLARYWHWWVWDPSLAPTFNFVWPSFQNSLYLNCIRFVVSQRYSSPTPARCAKVVKSSDGQCPRGHAIIVRGRYACYWIPQLLFTAGIDITMHACDVKHYDSDVDRHQKP